MSVNFSRYKTSTTLAVFYIHFSLTSTRPLQRLQSQSPITTRLGASAILLLNLPPLSRRWFVCKAVTPLINPRIISVTSDQLLLIFSDVSFHIYVQIWSSTSVHSIGVMSFRSRWCVCFSSFGLSLIWVDHVQDSWSVLYPMLCLIGAGNGLSSRCFSDSA